MQPLNRRYPKNILPETATWTIAQIGLLAGLRQKNHRKTLKQLQALLFESCAPCLKA
jgi:hypothetical protein